MDRIEFYRDDDAGAWRWRYVAQNGRTLADSGQGYARIADAKKAATRVTGRLPVEADGPVHADEIRAVIHR